MKRSLILSLCAICGFAAMAADWTYTITSGTYPAATSGTISDGDWTFAASTAKDTYDLTVGTVSADPGADATLDFSKPITDAGANSYTLVTLNPSFSTYANKTNLKTLKLPTTGLVTISKNAFNGCTSLTSISPFLPDSVTMVGNSAFYQVAVEDTLSLKGIVSVDSKAFSASSVTNVTFGAALKTLTGGYMSGCFHGCTKLVTVNLDPNGTGASFSGEDVLGYCSKLSGSLDLRGFTGLGARPFYFYGGSVSKMYLSSGITSVDGSFFHSIGSLKEITFDGGVPTAINAFFTAINNAYNADFRDLYFIVPEEYKDAWAPYCENGVINKLNSYFDTQYVSKSKSNNIYLIYKSSSSGGEKGYWVFDGSTVSSTNGLWKFAATVVGSIGISVGSCTAYPETACALDFSQKVTDADGGEMAFSTYANLFYANNAQVAGYDKVSSVIFAEDSTSVGNYAFRGCTALSGELQVGDLMSSIGEEAFYGCTGITSLKLGANVANINKNAFYGCTALESVNPCLPDSLTTLGNKAFMSCPITNACVMNSIVTIESSAIRETKIPSIHIGSSLKTFGGGYMDGAISQNSMLTNITISADVTNAVFTGEHAFYNNTKLSGTLDLTGFKTLGNRPFDGDKIETLIIGPDVTSISDSLLRGLSKLNKLVFKGPAPTGADKVFCPSWAGNTVDSSQNVTTYVYSKYKDSWCKYSATGDITGRSSTWASNYLLSTVTDLSLRRLILADPPPTGLMLLLR